MICYPVATSSATVTACSRQQDLRTCWSQSWHGTCVVFFEIHHNIINVTHFELKFVIALFSSILDITLFCLYKKELLFAGNSQEKFGRSKNYKELSYVWSSSFRSVCSILFIYMYNMLLVNSRLELQNWRIMLCSKLVVFYKYSMYLVLCVNATTLWKCLTYSLWPSNTLYCYIFSIYFSGSSSCLFTTFFNFCAARLASTM